MTITLEQIRSKSPCKEGWKKLNAAIKPGTTEVSIGDIALSNDAQDALWCTRCLPISERRNVIRCILPAVKRANTNTTNKAVLDCIDAIERWLAGDDSIDLKAFAYAADAAYAAERKQQIQDILAIYPATGAVK